MRTTTICSIGLAIIVAGVTLLLACSRDNLELWRIVSGMLFGSIGMLLAIIKRSFR